MEGSWMVTLDGESHAVKAYLPFQLLLQLTVYIDGIVTCKKRVHVVFGELCRFKALDHELVIRVHGYGLLGSLCLLIDGIDAAQFDQSVDKGRKSLQQAKAVLGASIVETQRVEEPLGEEVRDIDNSQSIVGILRKISVNREWMQSCVLERETTAKAGGELSLQGAWLVDLRATAEGAIRKRYEITTEERRTYSEELTITVPGHKRVQVILKWKQIWQCGIVLLRRESDGLEVQVPFRVCIGPTFDQRRGAPRSTSATILLATRSGRLSRATSTHGSVVAGSSWAERIAT
jgi:hypothetical protein